MDVHNKNSDPKQGKLIPQKKHCETPFEQLKLFEDGMSKEYFGHPQSIAAAERKDRFFAMLKSERNAWDKYSSDHSKLLEILTEIYAGFNRTDGLFWQLPPVQRKILVPIVKAGSQLTIHSLHAETGIPLNHINVHVARLAKLGLVQKLGNELSQWDGPTYKNVPLVTYWFCWKQDFDYLNYKRQLRLPKNQELNLIKQYWDSKRNLSSLSRTQRPAMKQ